MRILLITNSARGHAVAEALARSRHNPDIVTVSSVRDPGTRRLSSEHHVMDILDFPPILELAKRVKPDFAFIAPDDPIGQGLADEFAAEGIPSIAPMRKLAQIESSKSFTRKLMEKYGIDVSPKFKIITKHDANTKQIIHNYINDELQGNYVVKYDALKGGKGVKVSGDHLHSIDEGVAYAIECLNECGRVVLEEKLIGVEFSLLSFVSGTSVADMPAVQDHKRAFEGDTGPNTGGMGTYSDATHSLPFLTESDLKQAKEINRQVAAALLKECGEPYKGILYGGFIAVKDGIRVIEYNARFGDPEALNVLPILSSDFVDICQAIIDGTLTEEMVQFEHKATVCKYITPKSYPDRKDEKGQPVSFPVIPSSARLYYGDITEADDGSLHLGGSRTAGIVGIADTIGEAEQIAQAVCEQVEGPVRFRSDIGTQQLIDQRIEMMKQLR